MTDKEIIKALECCTHNSKEPSCSSCPARCGSAMCIYHTMKNALDLINRKQAEIERLRELLEMVDKAMKIANENADLMSEQYGRVKSEAVKEFAELVKRNKSKLFNMLYTDSEFNWVLDNLVKEMVGENND